MQEAGLDEGEFYKENAYSAEVRGKFMIALEANRLGAASAWKSAVKLLKMGSVSRPESYCFRYPVYLNHAQMSFQTALWLLGTAFVFICIHRMYCGGALHCRVVS